MLKLNGLLVDFRQFPNGETLCPTNQVCHALSSPRADISMRYEDDKDLVHLMLLRKHLADHNIRPNLTVGHFPYSRMDRVENNSVFTLKHVCGFINSLDFRSITIYEPHSDVCTALLNRVGVIHYSARLAKIAEEDIPDTRAPLFMFYPDASAAKRYAKQIDAPYMIGIKNRDFETGEITAFELHGTPPGCPFNAIIVDDLCSYGGTFIASAEELREIGAQTIYLAVTHCENSIFDGKILKTELIDKVYTTNTILTQTSDKIKIIEVI